jgi:hypothetical protein
MKKALYIGSTYFVTVYICIEVTKEKYYCNTLQCVHFDNSSVNFVHTVEEKRTRNREKKINWITATKSQTFNTTKRIHIHSTDETLSNMVQAYTLVAIMFMLAMVTTTSAQPTDVTCSFSTTFYLLM